MTFWWPIWLSGIQHNFLVSDLTAIQRLNIIIAHALWILKASLAPHFALLLIEWKKQFLASLKYLFIINAFNRLQGHNLIFFLFQRAQCIILHSICICLSYSHYMFLSRISTITYSTLGWNIAFWPFFQRNP